MIDIRSDGNASRWFEGTRKAKQELNKAPPCAEEPKESVAVTFAERLAKKLAAKRKRECSETKTAFGDESNTKRSFDQTVAVNAERIERRFLVGTKGTMEPSPHQVSCAVSRNTIYMILVLYEEL